MGVSTYAPIAFQLLTWKCDYAGCDARWDAVDPTPMQRMQGGPGWTRSSGKVFCPDHKEDVR